MSDTQESDKRNSSLAFGEALTVGFFRYVEEKYPIGVSGNATEQTQDEDIPLLATEKDSLGHLTNPSRFLARRAEIMLPRRTPLTRKGLERYASRFLHWMPVLIVVCGLALFPLGKVGSILSGKEVNLAGGFFWFLCGQLFFLACSFFFLSLFLVRSLWDLLFRRHAIRERNSQGFISRLSSLTGYVVFRLPDWWDTIASSFHHLFGRGNRLKSQRDTTQTTQEFGSPYVDFLDYLFSHRAATYFLSGFYSHLFWLCTSLGILLLLFVQMWSNEYKYSCRTSLGDVDHVRAIVQFFGYPFQKVLPLPDDHDVQWLFEQQTELPVSLDAESKISRTRVHWSHFLLATFFTWAVLPRFCMVVIYGLALNASLRTFQPRLKDDYYTRIIKRQEIIPRKIVSQQVFDDDETPGDERSYHSGPSGTTRPEAPAILAQTTQTAHAAKFADTDTRAAVVPAGNTKSIGHTIDHDPADHRSINVDPQSTNATSSEPEVIEGSGAGARRASTVAFGFESPLSQSQWQTLLPQTRNLVCFDDIAQDARQKNEFASWIEQNENQIARCIMLTDCSCPPARQMTLYLQKRIFPFVRNVEFVVILSRGERLREKFRNNTTAIEQRLQDWQNQLQSLADNANVLLTLITYYDHDLDLADARNRLTAQLAGGKTKNQTDKTKITQAQSLAMDNVNELFAASKSTDDEILARLSRFYENLTEIYREESRAFFQEATASLPSGFGIDFVRQHGKDWLGSLGQSIDGLSAESIQEQLVPATAVMNRMRQLCSRLSPRCALCAASIAATLPVAAALAPLAAGTLSVASVAAVATQLGTLLPTVAASGAIGGAIGSIIPLSFGAVKDQIVQRLSNIVGCMQSSQTCAEQDPISPSQTNGASVQLFLSAAMTWVAVFEFQGMEQSQITDTLKEALAPLEESSILKATDAQTCIRQVTDRVTQLKQHSGKAI